MNVGLRRRRRSNRIDDDHFSGRLRQPVLVGMGRRGVRVRSPHDDAGGVLRRARIEAVERGAVHVAQRDVSRHVANRVRGHLGCPEAIEESQRRNAGQQGDRAGVVRIQYRAGAVIGEDPVESGGNFGEGGSPRDRLEASQTFASRAPHGRAQAPRGVAPLPVVGRRAFAAQSTPAYGVRGVAANCGDDSRRA